MEGQSGLSELSIISWVSAVEGCPLSGVPLYFGLIKFPHKAEVGTLGGMRLEYSRRSLIRTRWDRRVFG